MCVCTDASMQMNAFLQLDSSFMAALPDDIRAEIESAYGQDTVTHPSSSSQSPEKSLHPLMRPEVHYNISVCEITFFQIFVVLWLDMVCCW